VRVTATAKGVELSKELGAERDYTSRHSTVIFPFYTEQYAGGSPWSELQIRVPIDDTHTFHISYNCYAAPPGVEAQEPGSVPYYEVPVWDEWGKPILECTLNQDFIRVVEDGGEPMNAFRDRIATPAILFGCPVHKEARRLAPKTLAGAHEVGCAAEGAVHRR
jgi:hypothetical protein